MSATDPLDAALRRLHLPAVRQQYPELAAQAVAENWSYPEYLERLAQAELVRRQERRLAQATRRAGFPFLKTLEEFDFTFQASLQRKALGPYLGPELVSGGRSLILWGPPGLGKPQPTNYPHRDDILTRSHGDDRRSAPSSVRTHVASHRHYEQIVPRPVLCGLAAA